MKRAELESLLERIAQGEQDAVDQLLSELENEGPATRKLFLEALNAEGEEMWDALILTLADDPYATSDTASRAAEQADDTSQAPAATIRALRSGDDRQTRLEAAHELAGWADPATVSALISALSDDRLVANAAMESLVEIGEPAVPALIDAARDDNEQVRWHATKALSQLGDARAADVLIAALDDTNSGIRWLAAEGLVAAGTDIVEPLLRALGNRTVGARFRQGVYHVFNKLEGETEPQTTWCRRLARRVRREPTENMPVLASRSLSEWRDT